MNILTYKDYEGTAEVDTERQLCRGKILFISDLVTYEADSPKELQQAFEDAVDDYLATCAELSREALKPLKGQFNIRIRPDLHKAATLRAIKDDTSLNEIVARAIDCYVSTKAEVNHHTHNHNVELTLKVQSLGELDTLVSSSNETWKSYNVATKPH